jgi:hypothetical protein
MANELTKWFAAEFRRLSRKGGDKHGPVIVYDTPANPHYVPPRYRMPAMPPPPCLCKPDTQAGIERRFAHARELLQTLSKGR